MRLRHMIEAAESVAQFIGGRQRGDLDTDQMLQLALARAIEIIGEAASRISVETRESAPTVPWSRIIAMRNRLVHAYFDVDHDVLWSTAVVDVPAVLPTLRLMAAGR